MQKNCYKDILISKNYYLYFLLFQPIYFKSLIKPDKTHFLHGSEVELTVRSNPIAHCDVLTFLYIWKCSFQNKWNLS